MFDGRGLKQLSERGISLREAERQLALFAKPPAPARLLRPCLLEDGILRLSKRDEERYEELGRELAAQGRIAKFVPASGAATRMFKDLLASNHGGPATAEIDKVRTSLGRFAFASEFEGAPDPLAALLARYAQCAKGLIPFHRVGDQARTAFEEHLREAADLVADAQGTVRAHFTVSHEHRTVFEALYARLKPRLEQELRRRFEVSFSVQDPSTDTVAGAEDGRPFLDAEGNLLFRPGGHGALIKNLRDLAESQERVLIKNIDNICHPRLWPEPLRWKFILSGMLDQTERAVFDRLRRLARDPSSAGQALEWARGELGIQAKEVDAFSLLHRPIRICGVVPNTGEPGGGPFWVDSPGGPTRQIVESAQIDLENPEQRRIFESSTHFNPVDLACGLRDENGIPYNLSLFVDESASFVSKKSQGGKALWALERPGLWNGAMAGWITLFVEVPLITFNPVKTLSDLLKKEHQPQ